MAILIIIIFISPNKHGSNIQLNRRNKNTEYRLWQQMTNYIYKIESTYYMTILF